MAHERYPGSPLPDAINDWLHEHLPSVSAEPVEDAAKDSAPRTPPEKQGSGGVDGKEL